MDKFCERLKASRKSRNASQKQAAAVMGVSDTQFQNYEYGIHLPTVDKLEKFCRHYNVSSDYLLGLTDEPRPLQGEKSDSP